MKKELLKKYFGYDTFREQQEEIIDSIITGKDTMAIMPTGAGKSLCYQLPALMSDGLTIVISPLISLMKDQVDYLCSIGIKAAYLNSSLTGSEYKHRLKNIYNSEYKIIYVAPERLGAEGFVNAINSMDMKCDNITIDEAHCVSRWGHDFRPSYTKIRDFIDSIENRPTIAAFTATATLTVRDDIAKMLGLLEPKLFITGFDRKNLEFKVILNANKDVYLREFIEENIEDIGIVYTATRKEAERINKLLNKAKIKSAIYHAGLTDEERIRAQEDFIYDNVNVMVATNAFGMGIDKSNVRYVIHYNMPGDIESYYQEAGRAGRDGEDSKCILLYSQGDTATQRFFIDESELSEDRKSHEYKKLQHMESYCHTSICLRKYMLEYFGDFTAEDKCHNCSVCNDDREVKDVTLEAQMILSCIYRSGQRFGKNIIADILKGSKGKKILSFRLDTQKTYGLMSTAKKEYIELLINKLIAGGYIHKTEDQYPVLKLTEKAVPVLKNQTSVSVQIDKVHKKEKSVDDTLLTKLKALRKELAIKEKVPPYLIFHDATLNEISRKLPLNSSTFGAIKGVGESKLLKYGEVFLKVIIEYTNEKGIPLKSEEVETHYEKTQNQRDQSISKEPSYVISCNLYIEGKSIDEIMKIRGFAKQTIESHIIDGYCNQLDINIDDFIQKEYEEQILQAITNDSWDGKLKSIKEVLPPDATYIGIRAVVEKYRMKL